MLGAKTRTYPKDIEARCQPAPAPLNWTARPVCHVDVERGEVCLDIF